MMYELKQLYKVLLLRRSKMFKYKHILYLKYAFYRKFTEVKIMKIIMTENSL